MAKKILIVRFSSIGDIVLTTPVIRAVSRQTGAEVHFLTKSSFRSILEHNPYLAKVWTIKKEITEVISGLRAENFDAVIDLHHNLRTLRLGWMLSGRPFHRFDKLNWQKWLLTRWKVNRLPRVHIVDRYLAAAASLGVVNDGEGLDYFTGPVLEKDDFKVAMREWAAEPYLAFVVGAAHPTKCLTPEQMMSFCQGYRNRIILLGGPAERALGENLEAAGDHVINTCGKCTLNESAHLVAKASAVLTHDTGLMHVAAAFRRPIVSVWGNTVPAFGMYPYLPGSEEIEIERRVETTGLSCRPCSKIGYPECPKGHFSCIRDIETADIVDRVNALWQ